MLSLTLINLLPYFWFVWFFWSFRWQGIEWTDWQSINGWRHYGVYNLYGEKEGHGFPVWSHGMPCVRGVVAELPHVSESHHQEDSNLFINLMDTYCLWLFLQIKWLTSGASIFGKHLIRDIMSKDKHCIWITNVWEFLLLYRIVLNYSTCNVFCVTVQLCGDLYMWFFLCIYMK